METTPTKPNLVEVRNLVKYFPVRAGLLQRVVAHVQAVDNVSFTIRAGETLGLVGESGCGKTTVGRTMLRLIEATSGEVYFEGQDVLKLKGRALKGMRRNMQIIFQGPLRLARPAYADWRIGHGRAAHPQHRHAAGTLRNHARYAQKGRAGRLPRPPLPARVLRRAASARIGIARALALRPKFIVCDEPVSALDVSIQSQVLNILKDLQAEFGLTYLFIAHNLSVVEHISDRVAVMYLGKMVELTGRDELFRNPLHPYTKALMSAIPIPDPTLKRERIILKGDVPSPLNPPKGCRFHPRCPLAEKICAEKERNSAKYRLTTSWLAGWSTERSGGRLWRTVS